MCHNDIKLSILVTFCRQNAFIKDAMESIINQNTNFNKEILVGLDNPDDECKKALQKYQEEHPEIKVYEIDNSRLSTINIEKASLNRLNLIKHARGEYFLFLDGDDYYKSSNSFNQMAEYLDKEKNIIGIAYDYDFFDNKNSSTIEKPFVFKTTKTFTLKDYLNSKKHIFYSCIMFRNIFCCTIPNDLEKSFLNDSTLTFYMLKYGNITYIPQKFLLYRTNTDSIFNSLPQNLKLLYKILSGEINHKIIPSYENLLCNKYKKDLLKSFINKKIYNANNKELILIKNFAQKHNCYFSYALLNYNNLDIKARILFLKNLLLYIVSNKYPLNFKYKTIYYFNERPNFGDRLNVYIIQRIFNIDLRKASSRTAKLCAIGSILSDFLIKKKNFLKTIRYYYKPLTVWGSGFIQEHNTDEYILKRKVKILALRGKLSKNKMEELTQKPLTNVVLGDPGLLVSKIFDTNNTEKIYDAGIVLHYVDKKHPSLRNIRLKNYKFIDIEDNPIKVLKEMAQCKVILSSAMHGLIAADSLNIPNQWIKLSDKLRGGDYKFRDYYSIFNIKPFYIDLNKNPIRENDIDDIINNHYKISKGKNKIIQKVCKQLLNCFE